MRISYFCGSVLFHHTPRLHLTSRITHIDSDKHAPLVDLLGHHFCLFLRAEKTRGYAQNGPGQPTAGSSLAQRGHSCPRSNPARS